MIVLDTHIWVWWVHDDSRLNSELKRLIQTNESNGLGLSAISLWEVAKLHSLGRLTLPISLAEWFARSLGYPGIIVLDLTPQIVIESTQLPGEFHKDPADQLIVATARTFNCPLATMDSRILNYVGVNTL